MDEVEAERLKAAPGLEGGRHPLDASSSFHLAMALARHALRAMPRRAAALVFLGVLHSLLEGVSVVLLLPVLASIGIGGGGGSGVVEVVTSIFSFVGVSYTLGSTLTFVFVVGLVTGLVDLLQMWVADGMERRLVSLMQMDVYRALVYSSSARLSRQRIGETTAVLTKFIEQAAIAFVRLTRIVTGVLAVVALVAVAVSQAWQFVAVTAAVVALALIPVWRSSRVTHEQVRASQAQVRNQWVHLAEELRLLPTMRAFGVQADSLRRVGEQVTLSEKLLVRLRRRIAAIRSLVHPVLLGVLCLAVYLGVQFFAVPVARLLLLVGVFVRLVPNILRVMNEGQDLPLLLVAYGEVVSLVQSCERARERKGGERPPVAIATGIAFDHVRVVDEDATILEDVTLTIRPRSLTALVGESGSGKTTIASALMGLCPLSAGAITVDGRDLGRLDYAAWRQRIGYVSQEVTTLSGSIRDNLRLGSPGASDEQMLASLDQAGVGTFVRALPQGLDSYVGEGGSLISGGERQRIAIARALLRQPALLILDEATSALDAQTSLDIVSTFERLRKETTLLVIAHDLDIVRAADVIYVVEQGRIAESGTWDELVERKARLFRMAQLQGRI